MMNSDNSDICKNYNERCTHCNLLFQYREFQIAEKYDVLEYSPSRKTSFCRNSNVKGCVIYNPKIIYEDFECVVQFSGFFQYGCRLIMKNHVVNIMKLARKSDQVVKKLNLTNPNVFINNNRSKKLKGEFEHPHSWIYLTDVKDREKYDKMFNHRDGWSYDQEDFCRVLTLKPYYTDDNICEFTEEGKSEVEKGIMSMETLLALLCKKKLVYFKNIPFWMFIYYMDNGEKKILCSY